MPRGLLKSYPLRCQPQHLDSIGPGCSKNLSRESRGCMALEALLLEEVYTSQQGETLNSQHQIETFTKNIVALGQLQFSLFGVLFDPLRSPKGRSLLDPTDVNQMNQTQKRHSTGDAVPTVLPFLRRPHPACWYPSHEGLPCASCGHCSFIRERGELQKRVDFDG